MFRFTNSGFPICISASACEQHALVVEADIIYNSKFVIGSYLLKCPKQVISRCGFFKSRKNGSSCPGSAPAPSASTSASP